VASGGTRAQRCRCRQYRGWLTIAALVQSGIDEQAAQILSHYEDLKYQGWSRQINEPRSSSSLAPPTFRLPNLTDHPLERDLLGSLDALLLVPECDAARTSLIAATGNETEVEILRVIEDAQTGVRSLNGGSHLVERRDEGFSGTTDGGCQAKDEGDDDPPKEQITETLYGGGELEGVWKIA
jgi:hypothetical protein